MLTPRLIISALVLLGVGALSLTAYEPVPADAPAQANFSGGRGAVDAGAAVVAGTAGDAAGAQIGSIHTLTWTQPVIRSAAANNPLGSHDENSIAGQRGHIRPEPRGNQQAPPGNAVGQDNSQTED